MIARRVRNAAAGVFVLALAAGCGETQLTGLTAPPPGKTAHLNSESNELELSRGVAFAFECTTIDKYSGPCRDATATSSNGGVAVVFSSYLDTLAPTYEQGDSGPRNRTAFIVVGLATGSTTLHVSTADGDADVDVSVRD